MEKIIQKISEVNDLQQKLKIASQELFDEINNERKKKEVIKEKTLQKEKELYNLRSMTIEQHRIFKDELESLILCEELNVMKTGLDINNKDKENIYYRVFEVNNNNEGEDYRKAFWFANEGYLDWIIEDAYHNRKDYYLTKQDICRFLLFFPYAQTKYACKGKLVKTMICIVKDLIRHYRCEYNNEFMPTIKDYYSEYNLGLSFFDNYQEFASENIDLLYTLVAKLHNIKDIIQPPMYKSYVEALIDRANFSIESAKKYKKII